MREIANKTCAGAAVFTNNNSSVFTVTGSTSDTVLTVLGTAASDAVRIIRDRQNILLTPRCRSVMVWVLQETVDG